VVANAGINQLRVAETEKYPHVTYFLNGGIEDPYKGEDRHMVPSPRDVKTYDLKPEMSAHGVTELVVEGLRANKYGLIVVNFANCDMVGHTGVVEAGVKAVETVDTCLGEILSTLHSVGGQALIIADHGNAEQMVNYTDGTPHTAHTTFPVPVILVDYQKPVTLRPDGALCDIAPTILKMMGIPQPVEMTGTPLF
jgi:2,3-bisphosphoglycerate-independent phosphoglycerate mutase